MSCLPEALLKDADFEKMGVEEFLGYLAKARYLQDVWANIFTKAIAKIFQDT